MLSDEAGVGMVINPKTLPITKEVQMKAIETERNVFIGGIITKTEDTDDVIEWLLIAEREGWNVQLVIIKRRIENDTRLVCQKTSADK